MELCQQIWLFLSKYYLTKKYCNYIIIKDKDEKKADRNRNKEIFP